MPRITVRSIWLQSIVCLAAIVGVIAGDITVAQARVAENHKREALRKLHHAEAKYVAQVDAISRDLFGHVQPVQNALDKLDATRPGAIAASRDAVVNSPTAVTVAKLDARLMKVTPTRTFIAQHAALHAALTKMNKSLKTLEHAKKSKDSSDMLDEPYSGAAYTLSDAEDTWQKALLQLDTATHRAEAPSPGSVGTKRPRTTLAPSKASWIFGADSACYSAGHAIYKLPEITDGMSESALIKTTDKYAGIMQKVARDIRALKLPARDRTALQRSVLKSL